MFEQIVVLFEQYRVFQILSMLAMAAFTIVYVIQGLQARGIITDGSGAAGKVNEALSAFLGLLDFVFRLLSHQVNIENAQGAATAIAPHVVEIIAIFLASKALWEAIKWVRGLRKDVTPPAAEEKPMLDAIGSQAMKQGVSPGVDYQTMRFAPPRMTPAHKRTSNEEPPELDYHDVDDDGRLIA
jgi:hypothetical protein